jgi:hypothetical protein
MDLFIPNLATDCWEGLTVTVSWEGEGGWGGMLGRVVGYLELKGKRVWGGPIGRHYWSL